MMWRVLLIAACVGTLVYADVFRAEEPIVLLPKVEDGEEAALLIVPGAYINGQYYQPLGEAIQAASSLKLWVGLVRPFPFDLPNPINVFPAMENTIQAMRDKGMSTKKILISGHSLGGVVMQDDFWSIEQGIMGWIMLASYVPYGSLASSSRPVMHVSGDLDGLTRVTHMWDLFRELEATLPEVQENVYKKPVVILPDVNHMHFASGEPPEKVAEDDILSPLAQEEAQTLIAQQVSAFLTEVLQQPEDEVLSARSTLLEAHEATYVTLLPLDNMEVITEGGGVRSTWTEEGQRVISSVAEENMDQLLVTDTVYESMAAFGNSKPHLTQSGSQANVTTYTHVYTNLLVAGGTSPVTPKAMATKFKSREAIMEVLSPLGVEFTEEVSCREVNQAALDLALSSALGIVRDRYYSRGHPVTFMPDDVKLTGSAWLDAPLGYNDTGMGLVVTSASLPTGVDVGLGLGGMHYCKLLTPLRALEYVMIDALRHTQV